MQKRNKALIWISGILASAAALILLSSFIAGLLLNYGPVRSRVQDALSDLVHGEVTFARMDVSFFPSPLLTILDSRVSIPGKAEGGIKRLLVYPDPSVLFKGKLSIQEIRAEEPVFRIFRTGAFRREQKRPSAPALCGEIVRGLGYVQTKAPDLRFEIGNGGLVASGSDSSRTVVVNNINASFSSGPGRAKFNLDFDPEGMPHSHLKGRISYTNTRIELQNAELSFGKSSFSSVTVLVECVAEPVLKIHSGKSSLDLDELFPLITRYGGGRLKQLSRLAGTVVLTEWSGEGPASDPAKWTYSVDGSLHEVAAVAGLLPGPLRVAKGGFRAVPGKILFKSFSVAFLGSSLVISGTVNYSKGTLESFNVATSGKMSSDLSVWLIKKVSVPVRITVGFPVSVPNFHIAWEKSGRTSLAGTVVPSGGPRLTINAATEDGELNVRRLEITDETSSAVITLMYRNRIADLTFSGHLAGSTANRIIAFGQTGSARVKGDFSARIFPDRPFQSGMNGTIEAENISLPLKTRVPPTIDKIMLMGKAGVIEIQSSEITWGGQAFAVRGSITAGSEDLPILNLDLDAGRIDLDNIRKMLASEPNKRKQVRKALFTKLPLRGKIRLRAESLSFDEYTIEPVRMEAAINPDGINALVTKGSICGIPVPGTITIVPAGTKINLHSVLVNTDLEPAIDCFFQKKLHMTGKYDLDWRLTAVGPGFSPFETLNGTFVFKARKGRIFKFEFLNRILRFINITNIITARLPELDEKGIAFDTMSLKGEILNYRLIFKEITTEGPALGIAGKGSIGLKNRKTNLNILVAPFRTIDWFVRKIPLLGYLLKGALISIPIGVTGPLDNVTIVPLSPAAIEAELTGILRRMLNLPFKIVEPFLPEKKKQ